jgi:cytochrome b561
MPNIDRRKIGILLIHMSAGMLIFALMAARFIVRMRTSRPVDATTGNLLPALGQERNN